MLPQRWTKHCLSSSLETAEEFAAVIRAVAKPERGQAVVSLAVCTEAQSIVLMKGSKNGEKEKSPRRLI